MNIPELVKTVQPYSMATPERLTWIAEQAKRVIDENIPGDFVECGVCNGGAAAILAHFALPAGRKVHLFDSFEGLPAITENDTPSFGTNHPADREVGKCVGSVKTVLEAMRAVLPYETDFIKLTGETWKTYDFKGLNFHIGWFQDTFPKAQIDQIAMLNLDSDWYESEKLCWETWYPKVSLLGFVYVDDFNYWPGCRKAADEYLAGKPVVLQPVGHSLGVQKRKGENDLGTR